ncbi:MAG: MATE family efflux transporter, partial [Sphingomicrobium sp.]
LGADALWLSFPVSTISNLLLATAYYFHGGWKKARMMGPPPSKDECIEQAETAGEAGGRISPSA